MCGFPGYHKALIHHLVDAKIRHWDKELRLLAAQAVGRLTPLGGGPAYVENEIIPILVANAQHKTDVLCRHGSLHALSEVLLATARIPYDLSASTLTAARNLVPRLEKARLYRGRGGEMVRGAACRLLECIALSEHPMSKRAQVS